MKITGIKVRQVEVPLVEPFRISLGVITHSRSVIVSVETDEGLVGYGEGAPVNSRISVLKNSHRISCLHLI